MVSAVVYAIYPVMIEGLDDVCCPITAAVIDYIDLICELGHRSDSISYEKLFVIGGNDYRYCLVVVYRSSLL